MASDPLFSIRLSPVVFSIRFSPVEITGRVRLCDINEMNSKSYCGICDVEEPADTMLSCDKGHFICKKQLSTLLRIWTSTLTDGSEDEASKYLGQEGEVRCYAAGCNSGYSVKEMGAILDDPALVAKYKDGMRKARERVRGGQATAALLEEALKDHPPGSLNKAVVELKLLQLHLSSIFPTAKQCRVCCFGPIMKRKCLLMDPGDPSVAATDNRCPNCQQQTSPFSPDFTDLPAWNQKLHMVTVECFLSSFTHLSVEDVQNIHDEVNGRVQPRKVPCWEMLKSIELQLALEDPLKLEELLASGVRCELLTQLDDGELNIARLLQRIQCLPGRLKETPMSLQPIEEFNMMIDEFDRMNDPERLVLHTAMAQQVYAPSSPVMPILETLDDTPV
jgi:hypothetical protein